MEGEELDVEEGHVQGHEAQEAADDEEDVRGFAEGGPVDHLATLRWPDAHLHEDVGDYLGCEDDECDDARRPAEADSGFELCEDDGVQDSACGNNMLGNPWQRRRTQDAV